MVLSVTSCVHSNVSAKTAAATEISVAINAKKQEEKRKAFAARFVDLVQKRLAERGGSLVFLPKDSIECGAVGQKCNAYFDSSTNRIVTWRESGKEAEWIPILAHEFSHFIQYTSQRDELWTRYLERPDLPRNLFWRWIDGKSFERSMINKYIDGTIMIEADAEAKTERLLTATGFWAPGEREIFLKKANAYIYFHEYARKYRVFYPQNDEPFKSEMIISKMPTELSSNPVAEGKKYISVFEEYYGREFMEYNQPSSLLSEP